MNESDEGQEVQDEDAKSKLRSRGKKRKRVTSESSTDTEDVLPENTLEFEKNLHASAIKNNLDDVSVKKILKKVVTNDHVLALVKLREEEEDSGTEENLRPKLTRAKAKELMKVSPKSVPWNLELTPIESIPVKTRPEVEALIAQELPEDEDDEEYEPTHEDVPSDDDHVLESSSDIDSLPRTPATPRSQTKTTPKVVNDGPFKVPQQGLSTPVRRKLVLEEEATIALRTRSKLSLSATSIEHIESSFVPPDDLPTADVDSLWNDFLKDCLNPVSNTRHEDDDEADPEYNVAADPDANEEDEESLENSIIKISKKELNDLVTELFNIMPDSATEQLADNMAEDVLTDHTQMQANLPTHWKGKQEPAAEEENRTVTCPTPIAVKKRFSIGKDEPQDQDNGESVVSNSEKTHDDNQTAQETMNNKIPVPRLALMPKSKQKKSNTEQPPDLLRVMLAPKPNTIRVEIQKGSCNVLPQQILLLQQQLRQHVQLAASNYLQLFVHPTHWARAPIYKEYLESLNKMVDKMPTSVVNVCNLKPALELVDSWEKAVSTNTKENLEMVQFIQKEVERSRRRSAQNSYFVGDFPEPFLQVVANSTVFLYPYLLPGMPFRPDVTVRRSNYLRHEDELISIGLDQFWEYVYANPNIYKRPAHSHPRHRWGLAATLQLVCKCMMPWLPPKTLLAHVRHVQKGSDVDNPIYKFFQTRKVTPVKHRLLPFNPQLTLYEQPEHEIPRIWIRYLAKSSNRFKKFLYSRNKLQDCVPRGEDIEVSVPELNKTPLPIDFNKKINCNRLNILPKQDQVPLLNRIDVSINGGNSMCQPLIANEIFTVLNTSTGSFLVPLQAMSTTDSTTTHTSNPPQGPLTENPPDTIAESVMNKDSGDVEGTKTAERSNPADDSEDSLRITTNKDPDHCSCCILIRNICRRRKRTITDYFKGAASNKCRCKGRRYPKMTNRLRILLDSYRLHSKCVFDELQSKLSAVKHQAVCEACSTECLISDDDQHDDLVTATLFQLKLTTITAVIRNNLTKKRIHSLLSKFDVYSGNVAALSAELFKLCEEELVGFYKEFTGFLTAEQADTVGHFKDYFIQRCMEKLIRKVEELVPDKQKQYTILQFLKSKFFITAFQNCSACDICTALIQMMDGYPLLAEYVFSLFPHRHAHAHSSKDERQQVKPSQLDSDSTVLKPTAEDTDDTKKTSECDSTVECEAAESSSGENGQNGEEEGNNGETLNVTLNNVIQYVNEHENTSVKIEEEEINVLSVSERRDMVDDTSDESRLVMSDDDTVIKTECPEWKRDEDKIILEVIKQQITPQERKDKTILEIVEETQVLTMISDSLPYKSMNDVKERILYLLRLLINNDQ